MNLLILNPKLRKKGLCMENSELNKLIDNVFKILDEIINI